MKRIVGISEPLLRGQKAAHVRDDFGLGLGHEIVDGLHQAVFVGDGQARASPALALEFIGLPATGVGCDLALIAMRSVWFDCHRLHALGVFQK